jgi:hypothetical protein
MGRLRIEQPARVDGIGTFRPRQQFPIERDAFVIQLNKQVTWIDLSDDK